MKDKINNALDQLDEELIHEAATAQRLHSTSARWLRIAGNIFLGAAGASAAAAAIWFGVSSMNAKPQVDLTNPAVSDPQAASSGNSASEEAAGQDSFVFNFEEVEIKPVTDEWSEKVYFGSEFPYIVYADRDTVVFTEGIDGLFVYDLNEKAVTWSGNIGETVRYIDEFYSGEFGDRENGGYSGIGFGVLSQATEAEPFKLCVNIYGKENEDSSLAHIFGYEIDIQSNMLRQIEGAPSADYGVELERVTLSSVDMGERPILGDAVRVSGDSFVWLELESGSDGVPFPEDISHLHLIRIVQGRKLKDGRRFHSVAPFPYEGEIKQSRPDPELPITGNSQAALCDRVLAANEPSALLEDHEGYYIAETDIAEQLTIYNYYDSNTPPETNENRFDNGDMGLDGIEADDGMYVISFVSAAEEDGGFTRKRCWVDPDSLLLQRIALYECSADGAEDMTYKYVFTYQRYHSDTADVSGFIPPLDEEYITGTDCYTQLDEGMTEYQILTQQGANVYAPQDGTVVYSGWNGGYGIMVAIRHENGDETWLTHLSEVRYITDRVKQGDIVGEAGSTGLAERVLLGVHTYTAEQALAIWSGADSPKNTSSVNEVFTAEENAAREEMLYEFLVQEQAKAPDRKIYPIEEMCWPLPNEFSNITTYFGYDVWRGGWHSGIDVAGNAERSIGNADIYAAQGGTVIAAENSGGWNIGMGNWAAIDHGNGYVTVYSHCSEVLVLVGQTVQQGELIARVGTTGWSTGNHLHFEVRHNGTAIDPLSKMAPIEQVTVSQ